MLKIGLTGGIGCGKSTVEQLFSELGAPLIDADKIAYEVSLPVGPAYPELQKMLPPDYFLPGGELDRTKLRQDAFSEPDLLNKLEHIIHPLVAKEITDFCKQQKSKTPYVVISIPLLIESDMQHMIDRILVVDCTPEQQMERVVKRDRDNRQTIQAIINRQIDRETRLDLADDIIDNSEGIANTERQVHKLDIFYRGLGQR